jgi:hypothetical protein
MNRRGFAILDLRFAIWVLFEPWTWVIGRARPGASPTQDFGLWTLDSAVRPGSWSQGVSEGDGGSR